MPPHMSSRAKQMMSNANRFAQSRDLVFWERQMRDEHIYYVYMMQSASRRALYIGMTNNLRQARLAAQERSIRDGFTNDYNCTRVSYTGKASMMSQTQSIAKNNSNAGAARRNLWLIAQKESGLEEIWQPTGTRRKRKVPRLRCSFTS